MDHSKFGWKATQTFVITPADKPKEYAKTVDKDGMSPERRKRINNIKDDLLYPEDEDPLA